MYTKQQIEDELRQWHGYQSRFPLPTTFNIAREKNPVLSKIIPKADHDNKWIYRRVIGYCTRDNCGLPLIEGETYKVFRDGSTLCHKCIRDIQHQQLKAACKFEEVKQKVEAQWK